MVRLTVIVVALMLVALEVPVLAQGEQAKMYPLTRDAWAYKSPNPKSTKIKRVHEGKMVNVVGIGRGYAKVELRDGQTAYVPTSAVALLKPADQAFVLSSDTPVYSGPSTSSGRLAEVHRGRNVHVVGVEFNYLKIRMKDGVEGFIPVSAVE